MVANWIHRMTGVLWPVALMRVMFGLTICLLVGALTPAAVAALGSDGLAQQATITTPTTPVAQPTTYRYTARPGGTTQVQRRPDGGLTWLAAGMIPELVAQLVVNPANDTVVFAETGSSLWRSGNSGMSWARIDSLPGQPLALAFADPSNPSGLIFAGTATQGLYSSLDGGTTWRAAGGPLSPVGAGSIAVTVLAVNPGDQPVIYAAGTFSVATPQGQHSLQSVFMSVDDGRRWFEMTPAPRLDQAITQPITQLIPLSNALLAVLIVGPLSSQLAHLEVGPTLIGGLDNADAGTRAATAQALGLSHDRSLLPFLMKHLRDPDLLAGDRVAQAIGRLGEPAAVPLLMPGLSDADEVVRARAAAALGLLHAGEAIPQLGQMLQQDGPWARQHAAEALAAIGTPDAMAALIGPLSDAEMTPARFTAMQGLEIAGQAAVTPLSLALMNKDPVVRRNAAEMLGWVRSADAVPVLAQSLSDQDFAVRSQAHWALGEINTAPAQLDLAQAADRAVGRPILATANTASPSKPAPGISARQSATVFLPATLSGALAGSVPILWLLAALAGLAGALAMLAAMLTWKRPRQDLKPC